MTDQSTAANNVEPAQSPRKRGLYTAISELGEYFTRVFIIAAKFLVLCFMYLIATIYHGLTYFKEPFENFVRNAANTLTSPFKRHRKARKLGDLRSAQGKRQMGCVLRTYEGHGARCNGKARTAGYRGELGTSHHILHFPV